MRFETTFLPPRTSTTSSVGISTRPILSCRLNAATRLSRLSLTFFSKPEYVWMMYHCMLIEFWSPLDAKSLEEIGHAHMHQLVHQCYRHAKEHHPGTEDDENLLHFFVRRLLPARIAELLRFQPLGVLLFIFRRCVVAVLAIAALQRNDLAHRLILSRSARYSMISVTAPAPTVCPPSRIANRSPFSSATGVIKVTSQLTLSPGITISTPAGSFISPVTSVVRK